MRNLEDIDPLVREHLRFVPCRTASDVLSNALLPKEREAKAAEPRQITDNTCDIIPTVNVADNGKASISI